MTPLNAMKQALGAFKLMNRTLVAPYGQTLVLEPQITNLRAAIKAMEDAKPVALIADLESRSKRAAMLASGAAIGDYLYLHPAPVAPEGWKLVPIEPTEKLCEYICTCDSRRNVTMSTADTYKAMLNAAPECKP